MLSGEEVKLSNPMPDSPEAWLDEIAAAYRDGQEAIPFGPLVGQDVKAEDLFHLAPLVCLKFRGIKGTRRILEKATDAALASHVATKERIPEVLAVPQLAFSFAYLASRFGPNLLDEQQVEAVTEEEIPAERAPARSPNECSISLLRPARDCSKM
jgi:hypothetical protein